MYVKFVSHSVEQMNYITIQHTIKTNVTNNTNHTYKHSFKMLRLIQKLI